MAVATLARLSEDKIKRQAYQRRLDELHSYKRVLAGAEEDRRRAEEYKRHAEEYKRRAEESERREKESLSKTAKYLQGKHYSVAEIAEAMELTEQKIEELLQKR